MVLDREQAGRKREHDIECPVLRERREGRAPHVGSAGEPGTGGSETGKLVDDKAELPAAGRSQQVAGRDGVDNSLKLRVLLDGRAPELEGS